jgi:peptidoglycan/xylan/chitin deacetylase (PgdA/CDA1 family)
MWNQKKKAVTFSFDDGVTQDIRLIEILNRYGLKGTFNINSQLLGLDGSLDRNGRIVRHDKIRPEEVRRVYDGHEVAVHTLTHPMLPALEEAEIIRQVEEDRKNLSELCGYEVVGMAYPGGGVNHDERVAEIIRRNTGVRYARTIISTHSFNEQTELHRFHPSVYYIEDCLEEMVDRFLALETDEPQLLYIWGHSYEMDAEYISWEKFEDICRKLAGRADIFYGTNREVLLGE